MKERLVRQLIGFIKAGRPLPLTLIAALLQLGIDVSALERKYNHN